MHSWPLLLVLAPLAAQAAPPIRFNKDIRPILSENCFRCHGFDSAKRKSGLRLDTPEGAMADLGGYAAIVKGRPGQSELVKRIVNHDPDELMPPRESGKKLTAAQIDLLKRWIADGAPYEPHWSFVPVARPEVPGQGNAVDVFVNARLGEEGLAPAAETDRATLARRVSLDLVGLPPMLEEIDAFVADRRADAYERFVDRLLASPHYGERMAMFWLDLVRYADSIGYHSDNAREVSPFRDYVIKAFNDNKPFDRFTVEQLAGDLVPKPTLETRVASTYNMLLETTEEGGAQPKEYEAKLAGDRVRSVSGAWLGATMGCAQCHDHKYDPYSARDFYAMSAFFADLQESPIMSRKEHLLVPTPVQQVQLKEVEAQVDRARWRFQEPSEALTRAQEAWEAKVATALEAVKDVKTRWTTQEVAEVSTENGTILTIDGKTLDGSGPTPDGETYQVTLALGQQKVTALKLIVEGSSRHINKGYARAGNGNFILTGVEVDAVGDDGKVRPVKVKTAAADYERAGFPVAAVLDGKRETGYSGDGHRTVQASRGAPERNLVLVLERPVTAGKLRVTLRHQSRAHPKQVMTRFRIAATTIADPEFAGLVPDEAVSLLKRIAAAERTPAQAQIVNDAFRQSTPMLGNVRRELRRLEGDRQELLAAIPRTLHSIPTEPRTVRLLPRGNWLDDSGEEVKPAVPHFMPQIETEGRATRLDLARWLVRRDNPLTARVLANRLWKLYFGHGLSRVLDDLGTQGEWPSHPQLLDYLAADLAENGWNVKRLVRLLVTSDSYRRSSTATAELKARDPLNRLFGRQTPFRLDAELVRDNALAISGLLSPHIGGPSVKPYQPDGYWDQLNFPKRYYEIDHGEKGHRRGLYTHWQRTFLHPSFVAFDASTREECTAERTRSNTPQQALVLLNDPTYVEAARVFAQRILAVKGDRLTWAFQRTLGRKPTDAESRVLAELRQKHLSMYRDDEKAARALVQVGDAHLPRNVDVVELATWTSVSRAIFNLHETITRN